MSKHLITLLSFVCISSIGLPQVLSAQSGKPAPELLFEVVQRLDTAVADVPAVNGTEASIDVEICKGNLATSVVDCRLKNGYEFTGNDALVLLNAIGYELFISMDLPTNSIVVPAASIKCVSKSNDRSSPICSITQLIDSKD